MISQKTNKQKNAHLQQIENMYIFKTYTAYIKDGYFLLQNILKKDMKMTKKYGMTADKKG